MEIVITHTNADFDAYASMVAVGKLYPEAKASFPGAMEENLRIFLRHHPSPIEIVRAKNLKIDDISHLILVDTKLSINLGAFSPLINSRKCKTTVFDHHLKLPGDLEADEEIIRSTGSTTTILVYILKEKGIVLSSYEASVIAMGIYEDTGCLTYDRTTPEDLEAVSYLRGLKADFSLVREFVNRGLGARQVSLLNELLKGSDIIEAGGVKVLVATASCEEYVGDVAVLASRVKNIENAATVMLLIRLGDHIQLVGRSSDSRVDVGVIARRMGGNGHKEAASASIKGMTLIEASGNLQKIIKETIQPERFAKDIMTTPVKSIGRNLTVKEARADLLQYDLRTLPIVDEKNRVLGIISRRTADRVSAHKLENHSVVEFMKSDIKTVDREETVEGIKNLMLKESQGFLPVTRDGMLEGVITRTDLLRLFHDEMESQETLLFQFANESKYNRNVKHLINERFPEEYCRVLRIIGEVADRLGFPVYLVGGVVRDLFLGVENQDLDMVVEKDGIALAAELAKTVNGHFRAYTKFQTAVVVFPTGMKVDIATARTEFYRHPAALPEIEESSIKQDLYRRDFTINTLAIQINRQGFGRLIDFFGGQRDIKDKVVRVLHTLSFVDDPTRMFRAIRFSERLDFHLGKHTARLIRSGIRQNICRRLEGRRVWQELRLVFQERDPAPVIFKLEELGLLKYISELSGVGVSRQLISRMKVVFDWYDLLFLGHKIKRELVYFAGITEKLALKLRCELPERLKFSENETELFEELISRSQQICHKLEGFQKEFFRSGLYRLFEKLPDELLLYVMSYTDSEKSARYVSLYMTDLRKVGIELSGKDLIGLGLRPGPKFKTIFDRLLDLKLDGRLPDRQSEIDYVRRNFL